MLIKINLQRGYPYLRHEKEHIYLFLHDCSSNCILNMIVECDVEWLVLSDDSELCIEVSVYLYLWQISRFGEHVVPDVSECTTEQQQDQIDSHKVIVYQQYATLAIQISICLNYTHITADSFRATSCLEASAVTTRGWMRPDTAYPDVLGKLEQHSESILMLIVEYLLVNFLQSVSIVW